MVDGERPRERRRIDDPAALRALAHPLRQRLWRLLMQRGPATVGTLASHTDCDPGQVSYHLRELATGGWVVRAPELNRDRRESWWRAVMESTDWDPDLFDDPADRAIAEQLSHQLVGGDLQRLRRHLETGDQQDPAWREASSITRSFLSLTPEEARAAQAELNAVLGRWAERSADPPAAGGERRPFLILLYAFPDDPAAAGPAAPR
ncbi:helix-turn-helix transcriptional regulator [Natronosporangium hydrolyticum]|uniref:Helix-turn-helix transcriptional regulator n=1 Tax=Natronosporangium hydrolyticum TaxID=2811111 RepID=A0A895YLI2_9ACTN|nr:helix-turn-helix domain-containing protein [Natronosporangium hydrolyticum]QSB14738.1 helix-turn-helix transcriptional regulator [Natronosporangium hydrolyticum]